ncbi:MAG: hypothetical protein ACRD63_15420, partial [Pyrinomonadaceae bacterium]
MRDQLKSFFLPIRQLVLISIGLILVIDLLLAPGLAADLSDRPDDTATKFSAMRADGYKAMYNLEYSEAQKIFEQMSKEFPVHPGCWHFLATNLWLRTLNDSRRLQTSLYNSDSFYMEEEDKVDPGVLQQFREWSRT